MFGSYLKSTSTITYKTSGSIIIGLTDAILYCFKSETIFAFCVCVRVVPAVGDIETYTCPYIGGSLSSPPHTWILFTFG